MTDPALPPNLTPDTCAGDDLNDMASAARELGLKPVRAWVSDDSRNAATSGAKRTRRSREKAEQHGLKQLSITVPADLHPMLKAFAARTKAGESAETVLAELVPGRPVAPAGITAGDPNKSKSFLHALPAWRRWLLRLALPLKYHIHLP